MLPLLQYRNSSVHNVCIISMDTEAEEPAALLTPFQFFVILLLILGFMIWKTLNPRPVRLTYFNHYTLLEICFFSTSFLSTCTC